MDVNSSFNFSMSSTSTELKEDELHPDSWDAKFPESAPPPPAPRGAPPPGILSCPAVLPPANGAFPARPPLGVSLGPAPSPSSSPRSPEGPQSPSPQEPRELWPQATVLARSPSRSLPVPRPQDYTNGTHFRDTGPMLVASTSPGRERRMAPAMAPGLGSRSPVTAEGGASPALSFKPTSSWSSGCTHARHSFALGGERVGGLDRGDVGYRSSSSAFFHHRGSSSSSGWRQALPSSARSQSLCEGKRHQALRPESCLTR
ncbi:uncharacterized protein LOC144456542 [Phascolarctos cinereus]